MLTKGIIEDIIDPYHVKVRIPIFDRMSSSSLHIEDTDLNEALICSLPHCDLNIQRGDIVFIGFEDNDFSKPIVLGYLYRSNMTSTYCDLILNSLVVNIDAKLPVNTQIGSVTANEIKCLTGLKENIQNRLDFMSQQILDLKNTISKMNT